MLDEGTLSVGSYAFTVAEYKTQLETWNFEGLGEEDISFGGENQIFLESIFKQF